MFWLLKCQKLPNSSLIIDFFIYLIISVHCLIIPLLTMYNCESLTIFVWIQIISADTSQIYVKLSFMLDLIKVIKNYIVC